MVNRIPRNIVEGFISRNKLRNTVNFLNYIRKPDHAETFVDYARRRGYAISLPSQSRSRRSSFLLFHGAQRANEHLSPSRREKFVYATDEPNYAIFLAVIRLHNASAGVLVTQRRTNLYVDLAFVNGPSSLRNGWVHILPNAGFKKTRNREYASRNSKDVLFAIPVTPSDLTVPITVTIN